MTCIRKEGDDCGNAFRASYLASVYHNAEFHQGRIHCPASSVDYIYIVFAHRFSNANVRLADAALCYFCTRDWYPKPRASSANEAIKNVLCALCYLLQIVSAKWGWLVPAIIFNP